MRSAELNDSEEANPGVVARELTARADRIEKLVIHLKEVREGLGVAVADDIQAKRQAAEAATKAAAEYRATSLSDALLAGTGDAAWLRMWQAAARFSEEKAYPGRGFPVLEDASCVLCQQKLSDEAADRLTKLDQFVRSTAQEAAKVKREGYERRLNRGEMPDYYFTRRRSGLGPVVVSSDNDLRALNRRPPAWIRRWSEIRTARPSLPSTSLRRCLRRGLVARQSAPPGSRERGASLFPILLLDGWA